jgi:hypothetical protein
MMKAKELAEQHWGYVGGLLARVDVEENPLTLLKYVYETAFVHGWKHCEEVLDKESEGGE